MTSISLNGHWNGSCISSNGKQDFSFSGTVPGCVHTDLAGSHIPEDIYYRDNANDCQWIEDRDWEYTKSFHLDSVPTKAQLVFEGLDTYADIFLNDVCLGSTENMFIPHRFDVSKMLRVGENTLSVHFRSPIREVQDKEVRNHAFSHERLHTRRIQCTYGWDWVQRLVTCGIWRDVYLDCTDGFSVKNVYIYTENLYQDLAQIVVKAELEGYETGELLELNVKDPQGNVVYHHKFYCKEPAFKSYIDIPNAQLWYPHGYGEQPLYTLEIGGKEQKFGIRTVMIEERPDKKGSPYYETCLKIKDSVSGKIYDKNEEFSGFRLIINGTPILCQGANWVPPEPFPSAKTDNKITTLLSLAKEASVNMLRVWGGGTFEGKHFYNECDRLGILVTQDFLMACGDYPEEKPEFIEQLQKEAEFAAYELRNHPSLVWWSGDNENAIRGHDEIEYHRGRAAAHNGIMPVLEKLDPKRRFLLSSPYGGNLYSSKTVGTTHNTQYLIHSIYPYILDEDMTNYKEHFSKFLARFVAEEPTLGATSLPSLKKFMKDSDIYDSDEMWDYHMKGNPYDPFSLLDVLKGFSRKVFGDFSDGKDRYFKFKYSHFEWIRISMENFRRNHGFINGMIYWMWNDCWPASAGWSFVDYYCLPKASFYSFKRCAGQLLASITKSDCYDIHICNNGLVSKDVCFSLCYIENGKPVHILSENAVIDKTQAKIVHRLPLSAVPEGATLICDAKSDNFSDRAFYKDGLLPIVPCNAPTIVSRDDNSITLTATKYIHAVELEGEYVFSDNYFSLLPDEQKTITFRKATNAKAGDFTIVGYTIK